QKLRAANAVSERVTELEQILASVHVVDLPDAPSNSVTFGATVTVQDKKGATETLSIVGVDELDFERDAVSWISSLGKAVLAADRVAYASTRSYTDRHLGSRLGATRGRADRGNSAR